MLDYDIFMGLLAIALTLAAYLGWYKAGTSKEFDRDGKILKACEAVHDILQPIALATPNKIDDAVNALLETTIKLLKDKEGIETLSEDEIKKMKDFFKSKVLKNE
jgi:hypothetical protein